MPEAALGRADTAMDRMYRHQRHIYDFTRKFYLLGRDRLIRELAPPPGANVLEIGCGTGRNLIRAAQLYPEARFYGLDISAEMLTTARAQIARADLSGRIAVAQADATAFDAAALFGVERFERVFISYALSMIPPWREVLPQAAGALAPAGSLHIVDFGDCAGLPRAFRALLGGWLNLFGVHPRVEMREAIADFCRSQGFDGAFVAALRGYAFLVVVRQA